MIAARHLPDSQTPSRGPRRRATAAPRAHIVARRRKMAVSRVAGVLALPFAFVMIYVALTANLTTLGYKVARAAADRDTLVAQLARNEDRIARLESPERLAAIAAKLGMRDPHRYAVVRLPEAGPVEQQHPIAFLSTVTDWLKVR